MRDRVYIVIFLIASCLMLAVGLFFSGVVLWNYRNGAAEGQVAVTTENNHAAEADNMIEESDNAAGKSSPEEPGE